MGWWQTQDMPQQAAMSSGRGRGSGPCLVPSSSSCHGGVDSQVYSCSTQWAPVQGVEERH